jgi:3-isopropylmalate dehydrogenase
MEYRITLLPGDGIGPEVVREAIRVLAAVAGRFGHIFQFVEREFGGASIDQHGVPLTPATLQTCAGSHAILLGAVGGPRWEKGSVRPEQGLLELRKALGLFANLRPVRPHSALAGASPVRETLLRGVDLLVVRELTGGLYFGTPRYTREESGSWRAVDTLEYTGEEIRRVSDLAFRLASARRRVVTLVDKANVLETSRLWRKVVTEVAADHPDVALRFMLVDTAAMKLISAPAEFDVLLTENMFGDILTDEASVLAGSLGMIPSASIGAAGPGLYEPIHGSAPDIAGGGTANPVGAILSAAMLLRHSLGLATEAEAVEKAVERAVSGDARTRDIGGNWSTAQVGGAIARLIETE